MDLRGVFLQALQDDDCQVRYAAAEAMAKLEQRCSVSVIEQKLAGADRAERIAAVYALQLLSGADVTAKLIELVTDIDVDVRAVAVQVLGAKRLPEALPAIIGALQDSQIAVAVYAVQALAGYANSADAESLVSVLLHLCASAELELLCVALTALGQLGGDKAIAALSQWAHDQRAGVRVAAITALGVLVEQPFVESA